jgi:NAD(P)-dependent dehydrogenase (short-subunit alcohol dehydrogenase family)
MASVLITGAGGGLGRPTVLSLLGRGHTVVAAVLDARGADKEPADLFAARGATVIEMDVTKDDSVAAGVAQAFRVAGGLDVVINNAGIGVVGVQESFTPDDWRRIFDVNVFGVQRVNRAVLPHMREKRSGLLIQVSSLLGRVVLPYFGPYNASKWAIEAMSENYRAELSPFGIEVAVVEPGGFPEGLLGHLIRPSDRDRDASLGAMPGEAEAFQRRFEQSVAANAAQKPQLVADAVVKLVETPPGRRPFRTPVDKMGLADAVRFYNAHLDQLVSGVFAAYGLGHLLERKPRP